jgi:hypothetical protein
VHDLVGAGRILDEEHEDDLVAGGDPLEAAEGGAEALETGPDLLERRAQRMCERCGGERVVDVVEAGERKPDPGRAVRSLELERRRAQPVELDSRRADLERRARVPAGGAAVVTEMADVRRDELVRTPAADAIAGIGRVLERRAGMTRVVDAVDERSGTLTGQVAYLRIVAVDDE